jgi:UrcA family protein
MSVHHHYTPGEVIMDSFKSGAAALTGVFILLGAAGTATASPSPEAPSITVHYGDLDFANPEAARVLYRRIRSAASRVCGNLGRRDLRSYMQWHECFEASVARAVEQVDRPAVTALHRVRAGRSPA